MALSPVDADGDLSTGGAEFLKEAAVSSDPQVILGYLHLMRGRAEKSCRWHPESQDCSDPRRVPGLCPTALYTRPALTAQR